MATNDAKVELPPKEEMTRAPTKNEIPENSVVKKTVEKKKKSGPSKGDIKKLARKGGVRRMGPGTSQDSLDIMKNYLKDVLKDSINYAEYDKRKTVSCNDVKEALKKRGTPIYGFD